MKKILAPNRRASSVRAAYSAAKDSPLPFVGLDQSLLGTLQDEPQPMQIVQATAAAQTEAESLRDKLMNHLPVPVGQADVGCLRQLLNCFL